MYVNSLNIINFHNKTQINSISNTQFKYGTCKRLAPINYPRLISDILEIIYLKNLKKK